MLMGYVAPGVQGLGAEAWVRGSGWWLRELASTFQRLGRDPSFQVDVRDRSPRCLLASVTLTALV